jgi:hypothetical protein
MQKRSNSKLLPHLRLSLSRHNRRETRRHKSVPLRQCRVAAVRCVMRRQISAQH